MEHEFKPFDEDNSLIECENCNYAGDIDVFYGDNEVNND